MAQLIARQRDRRSEFVGGGLAEAMLKQQVIPANNGILDEAVAGLGNRLLARDAVVPTIEIQDRTMRVSSRSVELRQILRQEEAA